MEYSNDISPLPKTSCANINSDGIPMFSPEKWEQIFCKLNQMEVAQARLVCPCWRTIIDNCYKFSLSIKERPFETLPLPFKVITCSIYQLKKNARKIFKYPYNVEYLQLLDKIKLSTLRNIFKETSNLKNLDFAHLHGVEKTHLCMPDEPMHFRSLLQLRIYHYKANCLWDPGNGHIKNIKRLFSYEMPVLQRLDIGVIEMWDRLDEILPSFFKFLAKHSKSINELRACFIPKMVFSFEKYTLLSEEAFNKIQPQNIMEQLTDAEFQVTELILALPKRYLSLWEKFINNQNELIKFHTERIEYQVLNCFCMVPFGMLQSTLVRNASTLVNLHLAHLVLERNENRDVDPRVFLPIDGLVFQDFNKLRKLILRRSMDDSFNPWGIQHDETTFVNISSIPVEFLEFLEIGLLVCETSELERLVENAPRLKFVIFHCTGDLEGKGVTTGIIDNLFKISDIQVIEVVPLNLPLNKNEWQKKLAEFKKQFPQAIQIRDEQMYYHFNFDRSRKDLVEEPYTG